MNVESSITQVAKLYKNFQKIVVIIMVTRTEMILTQGYEILLNAIQILAAVDFMGFHTVETYSSLGLSLG